MGSIINGIFLMAVKKRKPGRPKTGNAKTPAQRAKEYRERKKAEREKADIDGQQMDEWGFVKVEIWVTKRQFALAEFADKHRKRDTPIGPILNNIAGQAIERWEARILKQIEKSRNTSDAKHQTPNTNTLTR